MPEARKPKPGRTQDERAVLMAKARKGDRDAALEFLEKYPEVSKILEQQFGNAAFLAEDALLKALYGEDDELLQELGRRRMREMRTQLAGNNPTPLETLLVRRVVLCWLQHHYFERTYAVILRQTISLEKSEYYQRCLDRCHKRYLSAIKALAVIRRLQLPAVQVNIGEKQVNLVQSGQQVNAPLVLGNAEGEDTVTVE